MRGFKINVAMAEMSTPKAPPTYDQGYLPDQCPHFIFTYNVGMRCLVLCSAMLFRYQQLHENCVFLCNLDVISLMLHFRSSL